MLNTYSAVSLSFSRPNPHVDSSTAYQDRTVHIFFSNNRCQPKRLIWQLIWPFSLPQQRSAAHSDGPSAKASPRILAGPMQYSYRSSLGATTPLQELVYRADRHLRSGSSAATIWVGLAGGFPGCFSGVICIINNHQ